MIPGIGVETARGINRYMPVQKGVRGRAGEDAERNLEGVVLDRGATVSDSQHGGRGATRTSEKVECEGEAQGCR